MVNARGIIWIFTKSHSYNSVNGDIIMLLVFRKTDIEVSISRVSLFF